MRMDALPSIIEAAIVRSREHRLSIAVVSELGIECNSPDHFLNLNYIYYNIHQKNILYYFPYLATGY